MASNSVAPEPRAHMQDPDQLARTIPDGRDWKTICWADNPMAEHLTNRLVKVDHCIDAVAAINAILLREMLRAQEAEDVPEEHIHVAMPWAERHALHIGVVELMSVAEEMVQDIRENEHGICEKAPKGKRNG